jgi:copper/silver efflux system protein
VLTQGGAEAVGGVVVVREGFNPLEAINNVKEKIAEISPGLPAKAVIDWSGPPTGEASKALRATTASRPSPARRFPSLNQGLARLAAGPSARGLAAVGHHQPARDRPFYDRTGLIYETLGTLNDALLQQILVTIIVVILMVLHLRSAVIISAMLPLAVLMCFIFMKLFGVDSNIVSLAGIAIAIGTIVDMGIIVTENVLKHLKEAPPDDEPRIEVVYRATSEVGSAVLTAISTTVISFLPCSP